MAIDGYLWTQWNYDHRIVEKHIVFKLFVWRLDRLWDRVSFDLVTLRNESRISIEIGRDMVYYSLTLFL